MKKHISEDTLLKFQLELLEGPDERRVREHLSGCEKCSRRLEDLQKQTDIIKSFELDIGETVYPLPRGRRVTFMPLLKAAAVLAIGFLAGYLTSELTRPHPVDVVGQTLIPKAQVTSISRYTPCEPTDLQMSL